jgi:hypothetical protein
MRTPVIKPPMTTVCVAMPTATREALMRRARRQEGPVSYLVRQAVDAFLAIDDPVEDEGLL